MITITRKAMSLILTFAMLFAMVQATGVTAYAASSDYDRDSGDRDSHQTMLFAVSSSDDDRTVLYVDSGDITINGDTGGYVITQKDSEKQTSHTITVTEGIHNITLRGVNINSSGSPFSIQAGATVYLTLENENRLIGGMNYAGLEVQAGTADKSDASLIITDKSSGSLEAKGGDYSAGIGGNLGRRNGDITISGGTVTANGVYGAGIGSAFYGFGGEITISGGTVTANSDYGAGIGGGNNGDGGRITISGGTVTTTSDYGAGIGDGFDCGLRDSTITITGSGTKVTAKGYNDIGSGKYYSTGGSLTVGEDNVTDGPTVELQNSGTNANQKKFVNCNILGTGAKSMNIMGHYNKDGDRLPIEITLPTASAIASNSNLSVSQLSGGEVLDNDKTIEGTFSWKYGDTAVTASGNYVSVFTPEGENKDKYEFSINVPLTVIGIKTAPTASTIPYGSKLSESGFSDNEVILDNGEEISGTFTWKDGNAMQLLPDIILPFSLRLTQHTSRFP